jgi:hypothetical protein
MTSEEDIRARAYALWELAGKPEYRDQQLWLQAKEEIEATCENCNDPAWAQLPTRIHRTEVAPG